MRRFPLSSLSIIPTVRAMSKSNNFSFTVQKHTGTGTKNSKLGTLQISLPTPRFRNQITDEEVAVYSTPMYFMHTQGGTVTNLTTEVLEMLFTSSHRRPPPIQISIDSTYTFHQDVGPSGLPISVYTGHPNSPSFLTLANPLTEQFTGYNTKAGISIRTRHGRKTVDLTKFREIIQNYKPNCYHTLSDYDVSSSTSIKRLKKATTRNLDAIENLPDLPNTKAFATIELGWFLANEKEANVILNKILEQQAQFSGYFINGVIDGPNFNKILIKDILEKLPKNKPIYVPGPFVYSEIIDLVELGVDLFDSSVITKLTKDEKVLNFDFKKFMPTSAQGTQPLEELPLHSNYESTEKDDEALNSEILHMRDKRFFEDFAPISQFCQCIVCQNHTRSYVHHLLNTSELLGPALIMAHNLFQFNLFFEVLRKVMETEEERPCDLNEFRKIVSSWERKEIIEDTERETELNSVQPARDECAPVSVAARN